MFAGHVGAALALGRAERRVNAGFLVLAAILLDLVLWVLVLAGWESVTIPPDYSKTHQPQFDFPYSHGLVASIAWSVLAGAAAFVCAGNARMRAATIVAAAVLSHWLLDALVHSPEMPLADDASPRVGFGLWNAMPVALAVESAIAAAGLALFLQGARLSRAKKIGLAAAVLVVLLFTIVGMTVAPPPPSAFAMAASSIVTIAVVCALAAWFSRSGVNG